MRTDSKDPSGGCDVSRGDSSVVGSALRAGHCSSSPSPTGPDTSLLPLAGRTIVFVNMSSHTHHLISSICEVMNYLFTTVIALFSIKYTVRKY